MKKLSEKKIKWNLSRFFKQLQGIFTLKLFFILLLYLWYFVSCILYQQHIMWGFGGSCNQEYVTRVSFFISFCFILCVKVVYRDCCKLLFDCLILKILMFLETCYLFRVCNRFFCKQGYQAEFFLLIVIVRWSNFVAKFDGILWCFLLATVRVQ